MFNQTEFNQLPFNSPKFIIVFGSADLYGKGELFSTTTVELLGNANLDGEGNLSAFAIRVRFGASVLDGDGEFSANAIRDRFGSTTLDGIGELYAFGNRYQVRNIEFVGDFKPGDTIVINMEKMTVTLNGNNALHLVEGDFFNLTPGRNQLVYRDTNSNRNVLIRVTHRDRFV